MLLLSSASATNCSINQAGRKPIKLTLMSSRSRKLSMIPFLFHMIGGRSVPWIAQVRTALRPTVTVEMLIRWSAARFSCTTSVGVRVWHKVFGAEQPTRQIRDEGTKKRLREMWRWRKVEKKDARERHQSEWVCWSGGTVAKLNTFIGLHLITSGPGRINSGLGVKDIQSEKRQCVRAKYHSSH